MGIVGGFLVGILFGRWWALLVAVGTGVWIALVEEVDLPGWVIGGGYAVVVGAGIALGVAARKMLRRR